MKTLFAYLKAHPKLAVFFAGFLFAAVLVIGWEVRMIFRGLAQMNETGDTTEASAPPPAQLHPVRAQTQDPKVNELMSKYGLDVTGATYLAGAKTQVVSQTNTSAHLVFTFPDGLTADETVTIQPNQQYTPAVEELPNYSQTGPRAYNVKFSAAPDGDQTLITLNYFVPYDGLPQDMRRAIQAQFTAADWFQFVPSAQAQGGGAGVGVGMAFKIGGNLKSIWGAMKTSEQNEDWLIQLDQLEKCVKNPTNPVTQKSYWDNPAYQQKTLSSIENARSEVQQVTAARFLAQENAVAAGLVGGPLGPTLGVLTFLNDMTLKDVANQQIADVGKNVPECKDQKPSPKGGDGTIVYHMYRKGYLDYDEEDRLVQETIHISPGPQGSVQIDGEGEFQGKMKCSRFQTSGDCKGMSDVKGSGYGDYVRLNGGPVSGNCKYTDRGKTSDRSIIESDTAFNCEFHGVDLVNGGEYEVHANGEESQWATCKLDLKPQQK